MCTQVDGAGDPFYKWASLYPVGSVEADMCKGLERCLRKVFGVPHGEHNCSAATLACCRICLAVV